jgi:hypothetical protein
MRATAGTTLMSYTSARAVGRETSTSPDFIPGGRGGRGDGSLTVPSLRSTLDVKGLSRLTGCMSAVGMGIT